MDYIYDVIFEFFTIGNSVSSLRSDRSKNELPLFVCLDIKYL